MAGFREQLTRIDKRIVEKHGDQIDILELMANMIDLHVWASDSNDNYTLVNFLKGPANDSRVKFSLRVYPRDNTYGVMVVKAGPLLDLLNSVSKQGKCDSFEELLALAEFLLVQGDFS